MIGVLGSDFERGFLFLGARFGMASILKGLIDYSISSRIVREIVAKK